jgi:hypothetical protein
LGLFGLEMPLSEEEKNILKPVLASEEKSLSSGAIHQLIPFASTYVCETGSSNYAETDEVRRQT